MGGKKKLSLKQMEKSEKKKAAPKEKRSTPASTEKKAVPGITSSLTGDKMAAELKKLKVLTPYSVASRFELRLSVAKEILRDMERKGVIKFISKSRNIIVYAPVD
jgi:small subunit ribosomal protein S25e